MTVWVALLRAVNVGGVNKLPMADLRDLLQAMGCQGARTYIQSGNAVFRSDKTAPVLGAGIADAIHRRFGFRPPVLMLTRAALAGAVAGTPWREAEPDKVHLFFMDRDLPRATGDFLKSLAAPGEGYRWQGRTVWLHLPDGLARSRLARRVMDLPIDVTARNLRSATAILALADKLEGA